ncbi:MAG: hypothetical protein LBS36_09055 [Oscillospiraceae bacterium]|jgi:hypothetical protein|nr:hypothetical protein [Oscillospiraceae bacterium]
MLDLRTVFVQIYKGLDQVTAAHGFAPVFPEGVKKNETPVFEREEQSMLLQYAGEKAKLRILYANGKIFLLSGETTAHDDDDSEFTAISTNLLDLEEYGEKDVKFIVNEISDTILDYYGKKQLAAQKSKMPVPVSKSAAKSGALSYDPNTLANRLAGAYPELKEPYRINIETYGEFLAEDFFVKHGNAVVHNALRENNPQKLRKLFNVINEIYEDGTNELQSLIVVTILGSLKNDPAKMKIMLEYISDSMMEPVIEVNRILGKSKSANMRLENPPVYKPKKAKKKSGIMQMLGLE